MSKILAFPTDYIIGDASTTVHFELHVVDTTLRNQLGEHNFDVDVTILNTLPISGYYMKALEVIVDSFSDMWASGIFVLYGDIDIIGWREIAFLNQTGFEMIEDFIGGSTINGQVGEWNWRYSSSDVGIHGGLVVSDEINHPGTVGFLGINPGDKNVLLYPNLFSMSKIDEVVIIFKISGTNMSRVFYNISLTDRSDPVILATNNLGILVDNNTATTTANWSVNQFGAVNSTTAMTLPALQNKWYEMRLSKTSTTNWRLRVTNLTDRIMDQDNILISIASWSAVSLSPLMQYLYYTSGTGGRDIYVDTVRWRVSGLTRA